MEDWSIYLTPGPVERQLGLFCLGAGEQHHPANASPERALGCHAAVLVTKGSGHLLHGPNRVLHEVEAPALLWLFPGLLHGYRPSTPWRQSWALFSGTATDALTKLGYLNPTTPVRRYADPRALERAFAKLLRITRTSGSEVPTAAALFELIAAAEEQPGSDIVDRLKALACRPLTIKQFADELGLSVDTLRDTVRKATGSTPQDVILTTRLNEAKALLADSDLPVAAIARQVGYDDPAYFSRLFTTRVGTPPRTFRQIGSISTRRSSF